MALDFSTFVSSDPYGVAGDPTDVSVSSGGWSSGWDYSSIGGNSDGIAGDTSFSNSGGSNMFDISGGSSSGWTANDFANLAKGLFGTYAAYSSRNPATSTAALTANIGNRLIGALDAYGSNILKDNQAYSKSAAISDSQGAIAELFRQFRNDSLPAIYQQQSNSGGYNSTTGQLLANDAFASTVSKGAALQLDTIQKYRTLQQNDFSALANLFNAYKQTSGGESSAAATNAAANSSSNSALNGLIGNVVGGIAKSYLGSSGGSWLSGLFG